MGGVLDHPRLRPGDQVTEPSGDVHKNTPGEGWVKSQPPWVLARCTFLDNGPRLPARVKAPPGFHGSVWSRSNPFEDRFANGNTSYGLRNPTHSRIRGGHS